MDDPAESADSLTNSELNNASSVQLLSSSESCSSGLAQAVNKSPANEPILPHSSASFVNSDDGNGKASSSSSGGLSSSLQQAAGTVTLSIKKSKVAKNKNKRKIKMSHNSPMSTVPPNQRAKSLLLNTAAQQVQQQQQAISMSQNSIAQFNDDDDDDDEDDLIDSDSDMDNLMNKVSNSIVSDEDDDLGYGNNRYLLQQHQQYQLQQQYNLSFNVRKDFFYWSS